MDDGPDEETAAHRPAAGGLDAPIETPLEDAAEQRQEIDPDADAEGAPDVATVLERGVEVDDWDAAEQRRTVPPETDDYR
jgi:hypothetical protein